MPVRRCRRHAEALRLEQPEAAEAGLVVVTPEVVVARYWFAAAVARVQQAAPRRYRHPTRRHTHTHMRMHTRVRRRRQRQAARHNSSSGVTTPPWRPRHRRYARRRAGAA